MKLFIKDQEVEIKVKNHYTGKYDVKDTMFLINRICGAFYEESISEYRLGCGAIAKENKEIADQIFHFLEGKGFYD